MRMGGRRRAAALRLVLSVGLVGIIWPWQLGSQFVTSQLAIVISAFTAAMYVAGVVPDSFAGERERHTLETLLASRLPDRAILLGKIAALVSYGLSASAIMLAFGWATVNLVHRDDHILFYSRSTVLAAIVFSILAAGLMGAAGVLVSLRAATVKQAQQVLTTAVLLVLFVPVILLPAIPPAWSMRVTMIVEQWGAVTLARAFALALLFIQLILYAFVAARFKRSRLIMEQ